MLLFSLLLFLFINMLIIVVHLIKKGDYLKLPFWIAVINCGWFAPMAIGSYFVEFRFPEGSYSICLFFASVCTLSLWHGFNLAMKQKISERCWLQKKFNRKRLTVCAAGMMFFGLYFYYMLWQLPEELLSMSQWSGITVRYLFFSDAFKIGMICLLLIAFSRKPVNKKLLLLALPGLLIMLEAIIMRGRRSVGAEFLLFSIYILWFTRRLVLPRTVVLVPLLIGVLLVSNTGQYRSIMKQQQVSFSSKIQEVIDFDYMGTMDRIIDRPSYEFENYIYGVSIAIDKFSYDYGLIHWNNFVFNYIPAQIVGRDLKMSLMVDLDDPFEMAKRRYGHEFMTGSTVTGYFDAFLSFSFLGFMKFWLIGWIAGRLYRYANEGSFRAQLLYILLIVPAMQSISHTTNDFLIRGWVYFFIMGYPLLMLATVKTYMKNTDTERA